MQNSSSNEKLYQIALTLLPNIGSVLAKNLVAYCGSAEAVFKTPKTKLEKIPLVGTERAAGIAKADVLDEAEKELKFVEDYRVNTLFFTEPQYPQRLKHTNNSPVLLYYKGNTALNTDKILGIVGTRRATPYGKEVTKKLVDELAAHHVLIISGLAYGIDVAAHQAALDNSLNTVGVLGHGLNTIYPQAHKSIAKKMVEQGGLLTEYKSTDDMHPGNFANRNRIVAGMCDALVVVESGIEGGALITADIAHSYNRDVFAFPGRAIDKQSKGCNSLIKNFKATIIESAHDLLKEMNWSNDSRPSEVPKQSLQLELTLTADEHIIYNLLSTKTEMSIDELMAAVSVNNSVLAATLLELEMNNIIVSLPGKRYKLI